MAVKIDLTFNSVLELKCWLRSKNFEAGSPEAFSEWLHSFFEEGNTVTVYGEKYDAQYCSELV